MTRRLTIRTFRCPGTVFTYEGETPDGVERIETTVTFDTKKILGVEATVIRDRAWLDDLWSKTHSIGTLKTPSGTSGI